MSSCRATNANGRGEFIIVAVPLSAELERGASDAELLARREAEKEAIDLEWRRIRAAR